MVSITTIMVINNILCEKVTKINNFAISSEELGSALNNASSSLAANGNTFEETLGMFAAANATVQDADKASTALRTISARISASTTELSELGEDTSDVLATADLANEMAQYGVAITDANGELLSTYDILSQVANQWDSYSSTAQAAIAKLMAGTRQQSIFYSLIENWEDAEAAVEACDTATGELADSYEIYLDSIEGRIGVLESTWESFAENLLDSSIVKVAINIITGLATVLDKVTAAIDPLMNLLPILIIYFGVKLATSIGSHLIPTIKNFGNSVVDAVTGVYELDESLSEAEIQAIRTKTAFNSLIAIVSIFNIIAALLSNSDEEWSDWATVIVAVIGIVVTAVYAAIKAVDGAMKSNGILLAVSAAISLVVMLVEAIQNLANSNSYDTLKEKAQDLQEEWQDAQGELEETTDKIEELEEELENLKNAKLAAGYSLEDTSAYDAEIAAIQAEIKELEILAAAKEEAANDILAESVEATAKALEKYASDTGLAEAITNGGASIDSSLGAKLLTEYSDLLADYTYGENSVLDEYFEQYYWLMSRYAIQTAETVADGIDEVLSITKFTDAKEALEDFAESFETSSEITEESLRSLEAENEDVQEFLDYLVSIGAWDGTNWDTIIDAVKSLRTNLVSLTKIDIEDDIESISDKFDALSDALSDVAENGAVALDTLQELLENYPSLLEKYFTKTTEGYVLSSDYSGMSDYEVLKEMASSNLEEYIITLVEAQETLSKLTEEDEDYETALYNVAVAQDNLDTKMLEWATLLREAAIEEETDALEAQQDALEAQLDSYEDLIDLRKELLETYQEELDYQKELASKQKTVSDLQTQLAVARLDTSASGQAKVRELEDSLAEAQEELEDYTLEHAIEELTDSMDEEYEQYKKFINNEVDKITSQINTLSETITSGLSNIGLSESTLASLSETVSEATLAAISGSSIGSYLSDTTNDYTDMYALYSDILTKAASGYDYSSDSDVSNFVNAVKSGDYTTADSYYSAAKSSVDAWEEPEEETEDNTVEEATYDTPKKVWTTFVDIGTTEYSYVDYAERTKKGSDGGTYLKYKKNKDTNEWLKEGEGYDKVKDTGTGYKVDIHSFKPIYKFHSGGYVGNPDLKDNEVFAKLMEGEYVATPRMIENFTNTTLPQLAATASSGGGNNYYSPLISFQCDSITDSALPQLESMINTAINKLKDEMDSGASRAGYKTTSRYKI